MSYAIRSYDNDHGDPVVVMVVTGTHDVSRIVQALTHGNCEQAEQGYRLIARLKRHNMGRAALALLKAHGGADFTDPDDEALVAYIRRTQGIPDPGAEGTRSDMALATSEVTELADRIREAWNKPPWRCNLDVVQQMLMARIAATAIVNERRAEGER